MPSLRMRRATSRPGHVRQPDVEDDRVEPVERRGELEAGPAVGRVLDDVAVLLEEAGQAAGEALVVLDQKEVHRVLRCDPAGPAWVMVPPREVEIPGVGGRLGDEVRRVVDRDREAEALGAGRDRGVDADDVAGGVQQRAAAVAGVDRGVGLDQAGQRGRAGRSARPGP